MSLLRTGKLGVATSVASLRPVRAIAFQARQSVGEAAEKSKKWCVLVHFGARRARYVSPVTDLGGLTPRVRSPSGAPSKVLESRFRRGEKIEKVMQYDAF